MRLSVHGTCYLKCGRGQLDKSKWERGYEKGRGGGSRAIQAVVMGEVLRTGAEVL